MKIATDKNNNSRQSCSCIRARHHARVALNGRAIAAALISVAIWGCGGATSVNPLLDPPSLPNTPVATTSNTYLGTQSPGIWSLTLDNAHDVFSYQPITVSAAVTKGSFAIQNGITTFGTNTAGRSLGMAIERAGRATILRPGDHSTSPVAMINPSSCFSVTGRVRFTFAGLQADPPTGNLNGFGSAYGTLVVSTNTDGTSWEIGDQRQYELPTFGNADTPGIQPGTLSVTNAPLEYGAKCATNNGVATITAAANPVFQSLPTFVFNSAGYFVQDRPIATSSTANPDSNGYVGIIMPTAPLSTSSIVAASYRGFVYEPSAPGIPATQPMRLDQHGSSLNGGVYPNDDPTGTSGTELTISLGAQDSALYGVYPQATLTKSDPSGNCAVVNYNQGTATLRTGFDANGIPTCTSQGVAVVGNPDGKYIIYFTALDGTSTDPDNAYVLQMYLYQQ